MLALPLPSRQVLRPAWAAYSCTAFKAHVPLTVQVNVQAPGDDRTSEFHKIVREEYSLPCTVRQEKGQDIAGRSWFECVLPAHEDSRGTSEVRIWPVPVRLALVCKSGAATAQFATQHVHSGVLPCLSKDLGKQSEVLLQGRVDSLLSRRAQVASVHLEVDLQTWRT